MTLYEFKGTPKLKIVYTDGYPTTTYFVGDQEVDAQTYRDVLATMQIDFLDDLARK